MFCTVTRKEAVEDFKKLKTAPPSFSRDSSRVESSSPLPRLLGVFVSSGPGVQRGRLFCKKFAWRQMFQARSRHQLSAEEVLRRWRAGESPKMERALKRMSTARPFEVLRLNSALQSVVHFRAVVARDLATMTRAERCLDFSAGWGDRLAGFMASPSVKDIVLVEPRTAQCDAYKKQIECAGSPASVTIYRNAAEDILPSLRGKFDLILTSPPYFNLEIYDSKDDLQVSQRYQDTEVYLLKFLVPCALRCLKLLSPKGVLCLNVADNPRESVIFCDRFLRLMREAAPGCFVGTVAYETRWNPAAVHGDRSARKAEPMYFFCARDSVRAARAALR